MPWKVKCKTNGMSHQSCLGHPRFISLELRDNWADERSYIFGLLSPLLVFVRGLTIYLDLCVKNLIVTDNIGNVEISIVHCLICFNDLHRFCTWI